MGIRDIFKPKYKHSNVNVRLQAIRKMENQKILADIVKNDVSRKVRKEAARKIKDKKVLVDLAINHPSNHVRLDAIDNIDNEKDLVDVAINNSDNGVIHAAVEKIKDENLLREVYNKTYSGYIRQVILSQLKDETLAIEASNDSNKYVRDKAINIIKNKSELIKIAKNTTYQENRDMIFKKLEDDEIIEVISTLPNYSLIEHISDMKERILAYNALNNSNWVIRQESVNKINDIEVLKYIAENDSFSKEFFDLGGSTRIFPVRQTAQRRLYELN